MTERPLTLEDHVESFAHQLVVALVNLDMHSPKSAHVSENVRLMVAELSHIWAAIAPKALQLTVSGEHLRFGKRVLLRASLQAGRLIRVCRDRSLAQFVFLPDLEPDELLHFLQILCDDTQADVFTRGQCASILSNRGIRNIEIVFSDGNATTAAEDLGRDEDDTLPDDADPALAQYQAMADVLQSNHVNAFRGEDIQVDAAAGVVEQAMSHMGQEASGLLALAMHDNIDNFTVGHSVRVTLLALQVADATGASRQDLMRLGTAALLHDIGKSRIPQDILFKAGTLSADEREVMADHSRLGGEVLLEQRNIDPSAIGAAFCHHMSPGGGGYPMPALPFEPSGVSRLVRVCDVFEALTSARPYKPPLSPLHAYVIMQRMKSAFDPAWLRFFIKSIGLYPIGSRLELDQGEQAIVVDHGPSLQQPRVRLLTGAAGEPLPADAPTELTVGVAQDGETRSIEAVTGCGTRMQVPREILEPVGAADPTAGDEANCGCDVMHDGPHPHPESD